MKTIIISILLASFLFFACSKQEQDVIDNDWKVESIRQHQDSTLYYIPQDNIYILSFEKKTYSIRLDINSCSGNVKFKYNNSISFSEGGCTEACCDSDLALSILEILYEIDKYQVSDNRLVLSKDNGIEINLIEN